MDKIEQFVEDFFQSHELVECFDCTNQIQEEFGLEPEEAYQVVSKYLSKRWGIYGGY